MAKRFPLSKENFMQLYLPNLLINIWEYNDKDHNFSNCEICRQYEEWRIEAAKSQWKPEFKSFAFVIAQIRIQNRQFFDFGKLNSATRNSCYSALRKQHKHMNKLNVYVYVY